MLQTITIMVGFIIAIHLPLLRSLILIQLCMSFYFAFVDFLQSLPGDHKTSLAFVYPKTISPSLFLKKGFVRYRVLDWQLIFHPCSILTLSTQSLLVSKVSHLQSTNNLIEEHVDVTICFSLDTFKILSLSLSFEILILICLNVDVSSLSYSQICCFWLFIFMFFIKFGSFQQLFIQIFLWPFFLFSSFVTPKMCGLIHLTMFHGSLRLFSHFLFFSCPSDSVIFIIQSSSLLIFSACSNLPRVPLYSRFQYQIFFLCFMSLFIAIFILFIHPFLDFLHVFLQFFEYLRQPF